MSLHPTTSPYTQFTGILNHAVNALTHPWDTDAQEISMLVATFGEPVKQNTHRRAGGPYTYYRTKGEAVQYMARKGATDAVFIHLQPGNHKEQAVQLDAPLIDGLPANFTRDDLHGLFGEPESERDISLRYQFGPYHINFTFHEQNQEVSLIVVMANAPE